LTFDFKHGVLHMKKTFFIADVHLDPALTERTHCISSFLTMVHAERGELYILGDFFDYWANNRTVVNNNRAVLQQLKELVTEGCSVSMLIGNRDLLLSQRALSRFGITFLGEETEISLDGKRLLLTHGHMLCTMDEKFQRYKQRAWPVYRVLDSMLPGFIENYLAKKFILKSKQVIQAQDQTRFQFSPAAMHEHFQRGVDIIICGHAHKPLHEVFGNNHLYALPAWDNDTGGYLVYNQGDFSFMKFSRT
jgi:UDP-2,3-diacylglucosamine hydrolase